MEVLKIDKNHQDLVHEFVSTVRQFPKVMAKQKNLTQKRSEIMVLFSIKKSEHGEMKVSEISRRLNVKAPTVTQLINGLESKGQVERITRSTDRRSVWIRLTEEGEKAILLAQEEMHTTYSGIIDYLGEEETVHLISTLKKIHAYMLQKLEEEKQE